MSTLKVSNFARQGYSIVFPLFLFFSAIFCMSTRTNNLLHLSILLLLLSLVRQENRQALAGVLREQWQTWTLLAAFFIYTPSVMCGAIRRSILTRRSPTACI